MDLLKNDQSLPALKNLVAGLESEFVGDKVKQASQPVRVFEKLRDIQAVARTLELELKANLDVSTSTIVGLL